MKRLLNKAIILALMAVTWVSCSQDEAMVDYESTIVQESESDIHINLSLNIPDPIQIASRSGEVEESIKDITVLCFDKNGLALTMLSQDQTGNESGTLNVKIPNATRIMHVFANQENIPFEKGMSEYDAELTGLQATPGTMVYWARIEVPSDLTTAAVKEWWANVKTITLLRNQAKVVVKNNNEEEFLLEEYAVVYTNASGMAVPYYAEGGFFPTNALEGCKPEFTLNDWINTKYIHSSTTNVVPEGSDGMAMKKEGDIYIYETSKNNSKAASIIIKGRNTSESDRSLYWRVEFADANGQAYDIRRNHCYTVNIEGYILNGHETISAALENEPIGIKPDIADEVTAIKNNKFSLTVENTNYVWPTGTENFDFTFSIEQLSGSDEFDEDNLTVKWENDDQNVSDGFHYVSEVTTSDNNNPLFKATVTVSLKELASGAYRQEGTIVINYDGRLERKVKIIVIPLQNFTIDSYNGIIVRTLEAGMLKFDLAEWDYTQESYFMVVDKNKPAVPIDRLKFSIPADFPEALYPFNVLISTNDLNVWDCPLVFPGDNNRYGIDNGFGYKYVYTINSWQESYEVILRSIDRNLIADQVYIMLESPFFKSVKLDIVYPDYGN